MKACLYTGSRGTEWIRRMLPGRSPVEIPVGGKSWVRHAVDMCSLLEISDVFLADCFFYSALQQRLGDGAYWSTSIHYLPSTDAEDPFRLIGQHQDKLPEDDLLIFWGLVLPDVQDIGTLTRDPEPVAKDAAGPLPDGIYLLRGGGLFRCACDLFRMDTAQSYFESNMRMLDKPGIYNLPGYSSERGFGIGVNVITMFGCRLKPPLIVQDHTCLGRGTAIDGDVIVGSNVLIDDGSILKRAIILNNTYVGRKMHIENKVVCGRTVIDVQTGVSVELEDDFLVGDITKRTLDRFSLAESVTALILLIYLLPSYLLAAIFRRWLCKLPFFSYVYKIYPVLPRVVAGRADLVRNGLRDHAYAFRYSDQWLVVPDEEYRVSSDIYFCTHRSIRNTLGVVFLSLLKRLCTLTEPEN